MPHLNFQAPHHPTTIAAEDAATLGEVLLIRAAETPDDAASFFKHEGEWQRINWSQMQEQCLAIARGLIDLDLDVKSVVAILGPTHAEWGHFDLGAQLAGLTTLGIYPKQSAEQIRYLLEHSETKIVFVAEAHELERVFEALQGMDSPPHVVPWSDELWQQNRSHETGSRHLISPEGFRGDPLSLDASRERLAQLRGDDTAVLVYTSGTTGPPKGAKISHHNILSMQRASPGFLEFYRDDLLFSFLPMAHVTERVLGFYIRLSCGVAAAYASDIGSVLTEVAEARPTIFGSVPRLYEKAYAKVMTGVAQQSPTVRRLFDWALGVGRRRAQCQLEQRSIPLALRLQDALAHRLVFHKVHAAFGGRVRVCITGAAPTARDILEFFWAVGLPLCEGYGMTEATVITHINNPERTRLGTVGKTIEPLECRIADDGEILLKGPFVFQGYLKNPEATAETVVDGWLHTGDIGKLDEDGYLRITDRKKHLIITAGGKNLAPATIEGAIKTQSPLISQLHAHGDRRPYISALIAPSPLETLEWGRDNGLLSLEEVQARSAELQADPTRRSDALAAAMAKVTVDRNFQELFIDAVRKGNQSLARVEKVRRYIVLDRDFSQEGGELTPTMKVKRKAVEASNAHLFDRIYEDEDFAVNVGGDG